jgi:hypothetical protein
MRRHISKPHAGPPGYSGVTRSACIQRYMIRTGLGNSGMWAAMAIVESCGFHDTPDAALHMSVIGTFLPCQPHRAMSGFRGKAAVPQKSRDGASGGTCCAKENDASAPTTGRMRAGCLWLAYRIAHRRMTDQRPPFERGGGNCSAKKAAPC